MFLSESKVNYSLRQGNYQNILRQISKEHNKTWNRYKGISEISLEISHASFLIYTHLWTHMTACIAFNYICNSDYSTYLCVNWFQWIFDLVYFLYLHIWPKMTFCPLFDLWPSLVLLSSIFLYNSVYQV